MTEEQIVTQFNLRFLLKYGAHPDDMFIEHFDEPLSSARINYKVIVGGGPGEHLLTDWPDNKPAPLPVSSLAACEADGLIRWGAVTEPGRGRAIQLTPKGRSLLSEMFEEKPQ